ncbi:hypothetical protein O181_126781, partial [Austropuccinia psidii MF-1]|nr:hypothetical protein [Austropuccinia psidii MF-1]
KTRPQSRAKPVITPASRAPLDGTPEVPQLRDHLDRGHNLEGEALSIQEGRGPSRSSPGEDGEEEEETYVEEEESDGTEDVPALVGATLAQYNQPVSHQSEPSLLAIMQQMTQIKANLQAASRLHL